MPKISFKIENCKGCRLCINVCPVKILRLSSKLNEKGFNYIELIDKEKCTGCGMCFQICPDMVISID